MLSLRFFSDRSDWTCYRHLGDGRPIGVPIGPYRNLYTNSLLSSLNSRGGWRYNDSEKTSTKRSQNDIGLRRFGGHSENVVQLSNSRPEVFVHVESQETVDHRDSGKGEQSIFTDENKSGWQDGVAV
ncbi:hypothetical protein MPER_07571 [Moniliophthora perniciosa FA553]|nr:hypothetical protein MPER_07571 [Moniliophthora perniciosa FA553]